MATQLWNSKWKNVSWKLWKAVNDTRRKESNYQIKKKSERSEKKETYKNLEILEPDTVKELEMKEKEIISRTRKQFETKPYFRNIVKGSNTWAVPLVRYPRQF